MERTDEILFLLYDQMKELSAELEVLPSKCLLAAAFIAYLSDATEDVRSSYMTKWMNLCNFSQFDFLRFMSTEKEKLHFQQYGLPAEQLSHENAVITLSVSPEVSLVTQNIIIYDSY